MTAHMLSSRSLTIVPPSPLPNPNARPALGSTRSRKRSDCLGTCSLHRRAIGTRLRVARGILRDVWGTSATVTHAHVAGKLYLRYQTEFNRATGHLQPGFIRGVLSNKKDRAFAFCWSPTCDQSGGAHRVIGRRVNSLPVCRGIAPAERLRSVSFQRKATYGIAATASAFGRSRRDPSCL